MTIQIELLDKLIFVTTVGIIFLSWSTNDPETLRAIAVGSTIVCNGLLIWKSVAWERRLSELQSEPVVEGVTELEKWSGEEY